MPTTIHLKPPDTPVTLPEALSEDQFTAFKPF